jgi:hypothetical protein
VSGWASIRRMRLSETDPRIIANCPNPRCDAPIRDDHPYSWCSACGERLPDTIQHQLSKLREVDAKGQSARETLAKSEPEVDAACTRCSTRFRGRPKLTFLGFQKLSCPNCSQTVLLPLRPGYRITYWVIMGLMVLGAINALYQGGIPVPGLLGIAALVGIVKDIRLRRRLEEDHSQGNPE